MAVTYTIEIANIEAILRQGETTKLINLEISVLKDGVEIGVTSHSFYMGASLPEEREWIMSKVREIVSQDYLGQQKADELALLAQIKAAVENWSLILE